MRPDSFFGRTHIESTGTHTMAHFHYVVLQLEPQVIPVVHCILPPHHFNPSAPQDFAHPQTHEVHTWVVYSK